MTTLTLHFQIAFAISLISTVPAHAANPMPTYYADEHQIIYFAAGGTTSASVWGDGHVSVTDLQTGKVVRDFELPHPVFPLSNSLAGIFVSNSHPACIAAQWAITTPLGSHVVYIDLRSGGTLVRPSIAGYIGAVRGFARDGRNLLCSDDDGPTYEIDVTNNSAQLPTTRSHLLPEPFQISSDGNFSLSDDYSAILCQSRSGLKIWRLSGYRPKTGKNSSPFSFPGNPRIGDTAVIGNHMHSELLGIDVPTGAVRWRLPLQRDESLVAVSPDGMQLVISTNNWLFLVRPTDGIRMRLAAFCDDDAYFIDNGNHLVAMRPMRVVSDDRKAFVAYLARDSNTVKIIDTHTAQTEREIDLSRN